MTTTEVPKPNWEQIKKDAEAEKAALDAQKQLIDARKLLEAAKVTADPVKKALDDQVAAANAAKSLADASLAALKAQIGVIPASGFTGDVTLKDKAGVIEAALLAGKAIGDVSAKIIEMIEVETLNGKTVLLYSASEVPSFQSLISFRAQIAIIQNVFDNAQAVSGEAVLQAPDIAMGEEAVPIVAAAGLALDALNKIIGFFRTDYTVGGIDIAVEDSMLIHSVAGSLIARNSSAKVMLPAVYNAKAVLSTFETGIGQKLTDMATKKAELQLKANQHEKVEATYAEQSVKETDPNEKAKLMKRANVRKEAADALKAAINVYDAFFVKLVTGDDKGVVPLITVIREEVLADGLKNDELLLLVKIHKSGGAYYTKKNLWTFFGGMPFYHMGGVVGSFVLIGGKEGGVLASGVVPLHGGFVKADMLEQKVN